MKSPRKRSKPDFAFEDRAGGIVGGLDEVGRGPLAGPVVAACVIIPLEYRSLDFVGKIRDSKALSVPVLNELYAAITENFFWSVSEVTPQEIDEINILQASLKAMKQSLESISGIIPSYALVDGNQKPDLPCPTECVVKGDSRSVSIAAASILAKVHRDRLMERLAAEHPHYGWERNVGYPTTEHMEAIDRHGITPYHRKSFAPVRNFLEFGRTQRQMSLAV